MNFINKIHYFQVFSSTKPEKIFYSWSTHGCSSQFQPHNEEKKLGSANIQLTFYLEDRVEFKSKKSNQMSSDLNLNNTKNANT